MQALCKINLSDNHNLTNNLFSYYNIFLIYEKGNDEILKKFKIYEDELINNILNKNSKNNILFLKFPQTIYISIIENNHIYNFIINKYNEWVHNYF
jgi:hypothetical protein